jgi:hypothetical protein
MLAVLETDLEANSLFLLGILLHSNATVGNDLIISQLRILGGITESIHRILIRVQC